MPDWRAYVRERLPLRGVRPEQEQDIIDDLASQLDDAYHDARSSGLPEAEAIAATAAHITDWEALAHRLAQSTRVAAPTLDRLHDRASDAAIGGTLRARLAAGLLQDLRHAVRPRGHRGFFLFAATTLAVAVGINLIVFTVVNALWLRPMPFPNADRLVTILGMAYVGVDGPTFTTNFEAAAGQVTSIGIVDLRPQLAIAGAGRALETTAVTPGYFPLLGQEIRGRDFTPDDDRAGAEPVAIISDWLWSRLFERRTDVIGTVVDTTPIRVRIIGIAPSGFDGAMRGERTDVWIPRHLLPRAAAQPGKPAAPYTGGLAVEAIARLRPGDTATAVFQRITEANSVPRALDGMAIVPLSRAFGTPDSPTIVIREENSFLVVAGLAMLVLLGGCATLMALVLVHYERRRREQAVKIALGASRGSLTRELVVELALIGVVGTMGAIVLATIGTAAIPSLSLPGGVDLGRLDLSMDWRVFGVAILTTTLTLAAAAWWPVTRFTRARLAGDLLAGPATTTSAPSQRIRQTLLALHVAATIVVLVAAGLFVRAVVHGFGAAPGFDVAGTAFVTANAPPLPFTGSTEDWNAASRARADRVREAIAALPGVQAVAGGTSPLGAQPARTLLEPRTVEILGGTHQLSVGSVFATPDLLQALGVPIIAGRGLTEADLQTTPSPAVVTASLARTLWPELDPLGQTLSLGSGRTGGNFHVVGIARDFVYGSLAGPASGVVIRAARVNAGAELRFIVRGTSAEDMLGPIRRVIENVVPDLLRLQIETGREIVAADLGRQRLGAWFFSGFGLAALLLGVGGVFGLVAYLAESRRREFAVRLALGATARDLIEHGLRAALVPVMAGVAAGLVAAALVARVFTSLLTGLSPLDPLTYSLVAITMVSCAAMAGLGASWRLRRMAPVDALRLD
jgi:putative ABC transport system permease protein